MGTLVTVVPEGLGAEPAGGVSRGVEINHFHCIYAHLLCFTLKLNVRKFKFLYVSSF